MIAPNFDLPTQKIRRIWYPVTWRLLGLAFAGIVSSSASGAETKEADVKPAPKVSYYREIRPILQANCQGCHQPAKTKGGYMMTEFKRLLAGGDSDVLCTNREQKHLLHHRSHCRCHHRPQSARPVLAQQWRYFPGHAFSLISSAHANAAIAHDVNVSFQSDRRIVCFPGDA